MEDLRREMEDLAFAIVDPKAYSSVVDVLADTSSARSKVEKDVALKLSSILAEASIKAEVESRTKHAYSIYLKHLRTGVSIDKMHDLVGVRAIVQSKEECYQAVGLVHGTWTPVPGRFKDFIALPRPSGYQSLHTTVSHSGFEVEVQIRDEAMHIQARYGVAAHYMYKSNTKARPSRPEVDKELADALSISGSPEEFLEKLRLDLAPPSEIVVLTPKGRPVSLPAGSCVLDFAYKIHTDIGHKTIGSRINGRAVPIRSTLNSGDVVEILQGTSPNPKQDWLSSVKTARAREKIRKFFSDQGKDPLAESRRLLLMELRHRGIAHYINDQEFLSRLATSNSHTTVDDLLHSINSRLDASSLRGLPQKSSKVRAKIDTRNSLEEEIASALGGLPFVFAKCCKPLSVSEAIAYVSNNHSVSIHKQDCESYLALARDLPPGDLARFIDLDPDIGPVWVEVHAIDRVGLLRDLSEVLATLGSNIIGSSSTPQSTDVVLRFRVSLGPTLSRTELKTALSLVESVSDVLVY
jgi:GTP pyrophosphokinase